jgi:hypothetical protein
VFLNLLLFAIKLVLVVFSKFGFHAFELVSQLEVVYIPFLVKLVEFFSLFDLQLISLKGI